jgi:predicted transcriptional regulator
VTIPAQRRTLALDLVRRGHSVNDAAKRTGVNRKTISRWLEAEQAQASEAVTQPEASASPSEPLDPRAAPTELTRTILRESLEGASQAKADGNLTAAARLLKNAHGAAHDLVRADRERLKSEDSITFSRAELEAAKRSVLDRVQRLASDIQRTGGIVCSNCGRELRINLAKGDAP